MFVSQGKTWQQNKKIEESKMKKVKMYGKDWTLYTTKQHGLPLYNVELQCNEKTVYAVSNMRLDPRQTREELAAEIVNEYVASGQKFVGISG